MIFKTGALVLPPFLDEQKRYPPVASPTEDVMILRHGVAAPLDDVYRTLLKVARGSHSVLHVYRPGRVVERCTHCADPQRLLTSQGWYRFWRARFLVL